MTLREVDICLKKIDIRQHNTFALQAKLHRIEIPLKGIASKENAAPLDPKMEKQADEVIRAALLQKRMEKTGGTK